MMEITPRLPYRGARSHSTNNGLKGFNITLHSVQGYKLNDGGNKEANATTGLDVDSPARGSIIYSKSYWNP